MQECGPPQLNTSHLMLRFASILLVVALTSSLAYADNLVANYSSATDEYLAKRDSDPLEKHQSFVIMQGEFYGGVVRDRGLERTPFNTIAHVVSQGLKKRNFYPAKTLATSDLLIVVHWGVTIGRDRSYEFEDRDREEMRQLVIDYPLAAENQAAFFSSDQVTGPTQHAINQALDYQLLAKSTRSLKDIAQGQSVATLLGFAGDLRKEEHRAFASERTKTLYSLMEDDRYFIVVFAYDMKRLREEQRINPVWVSRLSIRAAGVNFSTALARLSESGSHTFGMSPKEVVFTRADTKLKQADVTIGEAIIIGTEP